MTHLQDFETILRCPKEKGLIRFGKDAGECSACGARYPLREGKVFFTPPPPDAYAAPTIPSERWSAWRKNNFHYFSRHLAGGEDKTLLDIGAGPSQFFAITSRYHTHVGVDFYPYAGVQVIADLTRPFPFADGSFDVVFLSNVLEHISAPQLFLAESYRVLRPGGMIIGTVPFLRDVHQAPYDFWRYTYIMLEQMLRKVGFGQIQIESVGTPFDALRVMQHMFFSRLLTARFSKNRLINFSAVILARFARKITHVLQLLYQPMFSSLPPSLEFTEGYGFKGIK